MHSMSADGVSITGLGKYYFCILRAIITEKENIFYFYLGKHFECISLSRNFNNYHISLNLLNKYGINILDLFDFNLKDLEILNTKINRINKFKEDMDTITDYFHGEKLFNGKSKNNYSCNNFRLLTLMKKNNQIYGYENNNNNDDEEGINLIEKWPMLNVNLII